MHGKKKIGMMNGYIAEPGKEARYKCSEYMKKAKKEKKKLI